MIAVRVVAYGAAGELLVDTMEEAPKMPEGLAPAAVAATICAAFVGDATDLPSTAFSTR